MMNVIRNISKRHQARMHKLECMREKQLASDGNGLGFSAVTR